MKKVFYSLMLVAIVLFLAGGLTFAQQTSQATSPSGNHGQATTWTNQGQWFCPWCGRMCGMHGRRMHGPMHGPMMRGGMMHHGRRHPGSTLNQPLSKDQAKMFAEHFLQMQGNPNLKLGKLTDQKDFFVAEITTKDGSLVNKLQIDKNTGWFRTEY